MSTIALLLVGLFVFIACQDQVMNDIKDIADTSTMVDPENYPPDLQQLIAKQQSENPSKAFFVMELTEEDAQKKLEELEAKYGGMLSGIMVNKVTGDNRRFAIFEKGKQTLQLADLTKTTDEIFTIVEEPASPIGGMPEFFKYVSSEITYPLKARQNNINGQVFIEFVVNEDGHISDVSSLKGIGWGCDEEAARVVQNAPKWNPAKQRGKVVKQRMVLPITFNFDTQRKAFIALDKPQEVASDFIVEVKHEKLAGISEISGTVKDANGKPIDGMNIVIAGTTTGTVTMQGGRFTLTSEITQGDLVFSFIGYKTKFVSF